MKKFVLLTLFIFSISLQTNVVRAEEISIIVNVSNPINEITDEQLAHFFTKRTRTWPNGTPVRFFDHRDESETRKIFLNTVLRRSARDVELFWIGQKLYTGNSAPMQISSDTMVASMVSRFPGAIGYVSSSFNGATGVKKITLRKE
jgi:ABC-type phosphate transport system substrate-binding protein